MKVDRPVVDVQFPALPESVRIARLVAGDIGARVGFSLDELDDIRLAVDEACAILIDARGPVLSLRMQADERTFRLEARAALPAGPMIPSELSMKLLDALVDSFACTTADDDAYITMTKLAREIA
ncbi:MAG: ATP-binding protein [Acidimicrobiia bacterium]